MKKETDRINILDGFRALAILPVIFYHYFSRWTSTKNEISLYPYDTKYDFFSMGYLGVNFFFIISGFVIYFTLERTPSIGEFWKKRIFRLLPSLLIASIIIYLIFIYFDNKNLFENSHQIKNFIPSLTLISPDIYNYLIVNSNFQISYLNGSFWSLWPEIQFYAFASVIYYLNRKKFVQNYIFISSIIILLNWILYNVTHGNSLHLNLPTKLLTIYQKWFLEGFNLFSYAIYFNLGILFFQFYKKQQSKIKPVLIEKVCLGFTIILETYFSYQKGIIIPYFIMITLFFIFIYHPQRLSLLENNFIKKVGSSSYFTYLIHENIGVLLINLFAAAFAPVEFLLPILVIIIFLILSYYYQITVENKISKWLKKSKL